MKKIFFALLAIAATMNVMATVTKQAKLTLTAGAAKGDVYVFETDEDVTDYNAIMNMTGRYIAIYVMNNNKRYEAFATPNLSEIELGFKSNAETSYTITATDVIGTMTIKLPDGQNFVISEEGASATFTMAANVEDGIIPAGQTEPNPARGKAIGRAIPTEFKVCHQYGKIIVDNPETTALDVLLDDVSLGTATAETYASEIEIPATVADGHHSLHIVGGAIDTTMIINVNPEVIVL